MPLYLERWAARPAWLSLPIRTRIDYLDRIGSHLQPLKDGGARLVGVTLNESRLLHRSELQYRALWLMPDLQKQVRTLHLILQAVGWYYYFDPVGQADASPGAGTKAAVSSAVDAELPFSTNGRRAEEH